MNAILANSFMIPMGFGSAISLFYPSISIWILYTSALYFIIDLFMMLVKYDPKNNIYFVHHGISLSGILFVYFNNFKFMKYLMAYTTFEISTIFLNISRILHKRNIGGKYKKMIDLLFVTSYSIVRILFGTFLLYKIIPEIYALKYPFSLLICFPILLQFMTYYWYIKIIGIFLLKE